MRADKGAGRYYWLEIGIHWGVMVAWGGTGYFNPPYNPPAPTCPSPCRGSGLELRVASLSGTSPQQEVEFFGEAECFPQPEEEKKLIR